MSLEQSKFEGKDTIVQVVGVVQNVAVEGTEPLISQESDCNQIIMSGEPITIAASTECRTVNTVFEQQISTSPMEGIEIANLDEEERRNKSLEALFQVTHSELENIKQDETTSVGKMEPNNIVIISPNNDIAEGTEQIPEQMPTVIEVITIPTSGTLDNDAVLLFGDNDQPQQFHINPNQASDGQPRIFHISSAESGSQQITQNIHILGGASNQETEVAETGIRENNTLSRIISTETERSNNSNIVFHLNPALQVGRKRKHPQKPGKYICTYCGRGCAKPSVLQKHIRAHTGERPYPCAPCGFSFKTKSNLYKHCKSRAHALKAAKSLSSDNSSQHETQKASDSFIEDESIDEAHCSSNDDQEDELDVPEEPLPKVLKNTEDTEKDIGQTRQRDSSNNVQILSLEKKKVLERDRVKTVKDLLQERKTEEKTLEKCVTNEESVGMVRIEQTTSDEFLKNVPVTLASTIQRVGENSVKVTIQFPKKSSPNEVDVTTNSSQVPNLKVMTPDEVKDRINQLLVSNKEIIEPNSQGEKTKNRKLVRQVAVEEEDISHVQSNVEISSQEMSLPVKHTADITDKGELHVDNTNITMTPVNMQNFREESVGHISPLMIVQQNSLTSEQQVVFVIPENKNLMPLNNKDSGGPLSQNIMNQVTMVQPAENLPATVNSTVYQSNIVQAVPDYQSQIVIEQMDPSQKRKKGRPKGSKNRPKIIPIASNPFSTKGTVADDIVSYAKKNVILRGEGGYQIIQPKQTKPVEPLDQCVQSLVLGENNTNSKIDQSLWKLKLKSRLLMKRSISTERSLAKHEMDSELEEGLKPAKYARSQSVNIPTSIYNTEPSFSQDSDHVEVIEIKNTTQTVDAVVTPFNLPVNKVSGTLTSTVTFTPLFPSKGPKPPLLAQTPTDMSPEKSACDIGLYNAAASKQGNKTDEDCDSGEIDFGTRQIVPLLLLGHQYPVIRSETAPSFCSAVRPQPMYVTQGVSSKLSMYSNWKVSSHNPNPMGLPTKKLLSTYQTFRPHQDISLSVPNLNKRKVAVLTHSSYWSLTDTTKSDTVPDVCQEEMIGVSPDINTDLQIVQNEETVETTKLPYHIGGIVSKVQFVRDKRVPIFPGGFKSFDEYVYIRGRGRGRFVCEECGIRCKKPSMLKKHIRTHTDLRPFNCKYCEFSFKTKGNLTKHMKSKSHYRKCMELGLDPIPTHVDDSQIDSVVLQRQCSNMSTGSQYEEETFEEEINVDIEVSDDEDHEDANQSHDSPTDISLCSDETVQQLASQPGLPSHTCTQPVFYEGVSTKTNTMEVDLISGPNRLGTIYGFQDADIKTFTDSVGNKAKVLTKKGSVPSIRTEIAKSLLDLSKQSDGQPSFNPAEATQTTETGRLTGLIGALISRTSSKNGKSDDTEKTYTSKILKSQSGRYAQKIAALQQANAEDMKKELGSGPSSKPCFVPPMYLNLEAGKISSPRKSLSKIKTGSLQEPIVGYSPASFSSMPISEAESTSSQGVVSQKVSDLSNINKFILKSSTETKKDDTEVVVTTAALSKNVELNQNTSIVKLSSESTKATPSSTSTLQIHYLTSENRAPFEIKPIPGKVIVDTKSEVDGKFKCNVCDKVFDRQHQLTLHKNVHFLNVQIKCEDCNITFQNMSNLVKHKKSESHIAKACFNEQGGGSSVENPRPFKCDDCNISFRLHGHLLRHFRSKTHISVLETLGKLPSGTFGELDGPSLMYINVNDPESVISSIKLLLKGEIPPTSSSSLSVEEQKEAGDTSTPSNSTQYENSILTSNENVTVEVINQIPSVIFQPMTSSLTERNKGSNKKIAKPATVTSLSSTEQRNVISDACEEQDDNITKCDLCGKLFPSLLGLKEHLVCHVELRPFLCKYCDAGFTTDVSLQIHIRTHQEDKPYICGKCGSNFHSAADVSAHMANHNEEQEVLSQSEQQQGVLMKPVSSSQMEVIPISFSQL